MADKKMSDFNVGTSVSYVYGENSAGNQVRVVPQDIIPYKEVQLLKNDFNEINQSGYCRITNGQQLLNRPTSIENNVWIVEAVFTSGDYALVRVTNLKMQQAIRTMNAGTWSAWKTL